MKYWMLAVLLGVPSMAIAEGAEVPEFPTPSDLPPSEQVQLWLGQEPGVREALSQLDLARHTADIRAGSEYEWQLSFRPQVRRFDSPGPSGPDSHEWTAQIERPMRLPNKARLDRRLGVLDVQVAEAHLHEVRHEAAHSLMDMWLDWLASAQGKELVAEQVGFAETGHRAVEKRQRAGDAAMLELNVAAGELSAMQRKLNEATSAERKALGKLRVRYPDVQRTPPRLADPLPLEEPESAWRERILATSDPLLQADLEVQRAQEAVARAGADRIPDPTLMFYTASEARGEEKIMGLQVNVPIPGRMRMRHLDQALDTLSMAKASRETRRREIEIEIAENYSDASSNYERWQLAEQAAGKTRENARLAQRGYELGETDLETLLLARRQSAEAAESALDARVDALRAHYALLINAHQIWQLSRE